jgi:hypothetical protein
MLLVELLIGIDIKVEWGKKKRERENKRERKW